jgi:hypothetical protein
MQTARNGETNRQISVANMPEKNYIIICSNIAVVFVLVFLEHENLEH